MPHLAAAALAAGLIGLAAAAAIDAPSLPASSDVAAGTRADSFFQAVALHRWGYGALDWLIPDRGDRR